ncbi:MAG: VaFE repeat-containing surface-anchored protein [Eubacteriales bacterium]|nr:VaFE repeat-containing surface-anchored protein [Eubacteriales bacterium]
MNQKMGYFQRKKVRSGIHRMLSLMLVVPMLASTVTMASASTIEASEAEMLGAGESTAALVSGAVNEAAADIVSSPDGDWTYEVETAAEVSSSDSASADAGDAAGSAGSGHAADAGDAAGSAGTGTVADEGGAFVSGDENAAQSSALSAAEDSAQNAQESGAASGQADLSGAKSEGDGNADSRLQDSAKKSGEEKDDAGKTGERSDKDAEKEGAAEENGKDTEKEDSEKDDEEDSEKEDDEDSEEESREDLVLTDEASGVTVVIPYTSIPEGVKRKQIGLEVRGLTEEETEAFLDAVQVSENMVRWLYDITLRNSETGEVIQPSDAVTIRVEEEMGEDISVVRIEEEGGYTELETGANGDVSSFETEHFSLYGGVSFTGSMRYYGWKYNGSGQLMLAYYENQQYYTAFCIDETTTFRADDQFTIHENVTVEEFEQYAYHTASISEDDFKMLKRMMYLYETTYKNAASDNFYLDVSLGRNRLNFSTYYSSEEAVQLKHWVLFQVILHACLKNGVSENSVMNGGMNSYGNDTSRRFRELYWQAATDSSKDGIIDSTYDFLIGEKNGNQNVVIIKEKDSSIDTIVHAADGYSTSAMALPLSVEDLTASADYPGMYEVPVQDTVYYYGFDNGSYDITGYLYKVEADGSVDESAPVASALRSNETLGGTGSIVMDFGTLPLDPNARYVVYETVESVGMTPQRRYEHKDSGDNAQSFTISEILTSVEAEGNETAIPVTLTPEEIGEQVHIIDTIAYRNMPLTAYRIDAELYEVVWDESTNGYVPTGDPAATAAVDSYTITTANGTIPVDFGQVTGLQDGKRYVVFQTMTSIADLVDTDGDGQADAKHVITHKDANDSAQTLRVSEPDETYFRVAKAWDEELKDKKQPITVRLYDNGEPAEIEGVTTEVILSENNSWTYKWTKLPKEGHDYTAVEVLSGEEAYYPVYEADREFTFTVNKEVDTTVETSTTTQVQRWAPYTGSSFQAGDEIILVVDREQRYNGSSPLTPVGKVGQAMSLQVNSRTNYYQLDWESGPAEDTKGNVAEETVTDSMIWIVESAGSSGIYLKNKLNSTAYLYRNGGSVGITTHKTPFAVRDGYLITTDYSNWYVSYGSAGSSTGFYIRPNGATTHFKVYRKMLVDETVSTVVPGTETVEETVNEKAYLITNKPGKPAQTVGEIEIVKVDAEDTEIRIAGAVFDLYQADPEAEDYIPYTDVKGRPVEGASGLFSDEEGRIRIEDLEFGSYYLVESQAPAGYQKHEAAILLTLDAEGVRVESEAAEVTDSQVYAIEKDGHVIGEEDSWSLCMNGLRKHPGDYGVSRGEYIKHYDVSYEDIRQYIDTLDNPNRTTNHTVTYKTFSQDAYIGMQRTLYWYLVYGKAFGSDGFTAAQRILRIFTDGSGATATSQSLKGYRECYEFAVNNKRKDSNGEYTIEAEDDAYVASRVKVHVYENTEAATIGYLQNMVTAVLVEPGEAVQHVEGKVQVKNTRIPEIPEEPEEPENPLIAPETGGRGVRVIYGIGGLLCLAGILYFVFRKRKRA